MQRMTTQERCLCPSDLESTALADAGPISISTRTKLGTHKQSFQTYSGMEVTVSPSR